MLPASLGLPVSSREITKVSTVPVTRQETAFAIERWRFSKEPPADDPPATLLARPAWAKPKPYLA